LNFLLADPEAGPLADMKNTIGIIGGSGMLGRTIARAILDRKIVAPENLWISNRSGELQGFEDHPGINITTSNRELAEACRLIILSVPPALASQIGIEVPNRLVASVMAGVTISRIREITGSKRVVRAMSSPAAEFGLAYSPWVAGPDVDSRDREVIFSVFEACGLTDEIEDESQIDCFTALTGPVPGFVAYFAECMVNYAVLTGISPRVADRAVRQLFLAGGKMLAEGSATPADHVRHMIDYAGTTAEGLLAMKASPVADAIADGLNAAVEKSRRMG
jgi:pyrroline-5-carboxylate reductase